MLCGMLCGVSILALAKSSVLIQSDLMARSAAGSLATWPENTSADASGIGNATEHAIAKWQAFRWRKSKDCQHVIQVVLSLRANANHQNLKLEEILTRHLPRLFMPNTEDAFFTMAAEEEGRWTERLKMLKEDESPLRCNECGKRVGTPHSTLELVPANTMSARICCSRSCLETYCEAKTGWNPNSKAMKDGPQTEFLRKAPGASSCDWNG